MINHVPLMLDLPRFWFRRAGEVKTREAEVECHQVADCSTSSPFGGADDRSLTGAVPKLRVE